MTKHILNTLLYVVLCIMLCCPLYSQNTQIIEAVQEPYTPESLIRNYFIGEGVEILNINFEGENSATGYFSNGFNDLGIDQGIVLGTGKVDRFTDPSSTESSTLTSDQDVINQELADIIGANLLKDVITYEITFIPTADSIQFKYVFASEEYPEYVCSEFNDVFGFFISGPNPDGGQYNSRNIAIVPGTNNLPVSINNVNNGMAGSSGNQANCNQLANLNYAEFYNQNNSEHLIFDGVLEPFIASAKVTPCETYTMKFSIGDVNDFLKDSAVFLEGKSFSSNTIELKAVTASANGTITEGCASASIQFELPQIAVNSETISFELLGTAQNGIDYESIPTSITIPIGENTAIIQITPFEDNLEEEIESIGIAITNGDCLSDTIWLGIEDNLLIGPEEVGPIFLCDNSSNQVDFTIPFDAPNPTIFRNQNDIKIEPINTPIYSTITVENIYPSSLSQANFIQVCIDELTHPWIEDVSIYLYGPNNQFIELTSKNGGNGGNGTQTDYYLNTCFTLDASQLISDAALTPPYIGSYKPEGNWDDFLSSTSYQVNGDWKLMMIDDFQGSIGTLHSWSIHFDKSYDISYSWSPSTGISCTDCPNPTFNPTESQLYTLDIEDTNGCTLSYEVMVNADTDILPAPIILCQNEIEGEIIFSWEQIEGAESYEISIENGEWQNVGLDSNFLVNGLTAGANTQFEIQALGPCGDSEISLQSCSTTECQIELNIVSTVDPGCDINNSGMLIVKAEGGSEPYTYSFGDVENISGQFENLIEGEHIIQVIDNNDCIDTVIVSLTGKEGILINGITNHIICGEETGSIDLSVTGGEGQLEFDWSDNFTGNTETLQAGTYQLRVTDAFGCSAEEEFTIENIANFTAEFLATSPSCSELANGSIEVIILDMSIIDKIEWDNGIEGPFIENLTAGAYNVLITSNDGCQLNKEVDLLPISTIEIETQKLDNFCFGESEGMVNISATGGTSPYEINWSNNQTGEQIEDLYAGSYIATISDLNGCQTFDTIVIEDPLPLSMADLQIETPNCDLLMGSIEVNPIGGTAPYLFSLNENAFQEENVFSNLNPGSYTLELLDSYGCRTNSVQEITIPVYEEIDLITEPTIQLSFGDSIKLFAYVSNRETESNYEWISIDSQYLSCTNCQEPTLYGLNSTTISVKAIDENGCEVINNIVVQVNNSKSIFIPNTFSPNGDGINDKLSIFAKERIISSIDDYSIYDKWGNQIFQTKDIEVNNMNDGWNGTYRGENMNQGIFIWKLIVTYIDGQTEILSGNAALIR